MSVCNVKVKFLRPQYNNLKEWMQDENNVYIGREGIVFIDNERFPKKRSPWANPYKVGKDGNLEEVLEKYRNYIKTQNLDIETLRGKNLGCWCISCGKTDEIFPVECHGQILLEMLQKRNKRRFSRYNRMTKTYDYFYTNTNDETP